MKTWEDYYKACKYYLFHEALGEKEVTMEEYVKAERSAGFRPKDRSGEGLPATGGFGGSGIRGSVETTPEAMAILKEIDF